MKAFYVITNFSLLECPGYEVSFCINVLNEVYLTTSSFCTSRTRIMSNIRRLYLIVVSSCFIASYIGS